MLAVALVLGGRLVEIQLFHHDLYRTQAENQWRHPVELAPARGNLYDRQHRPLALTVNLWRVGVATKLASDPAQVAALLAEVLGQPPAALARRIRDAAGKHVVLARQLVLSRAELQDLRAEPAITLEERCERVYPLGGVGASLIGRFTDGGQGPDPSTGLEFSLASHLAGVPGRAWRLAAGGRGDKSLGNIVVQEARHGRDLVLTLDADLQEICENELSRRVAACGAIGGAVLIIDPNRGDLLGAAGWPVVEDRRRQGGDPAAWNNFNFTGMYEPGSVFKIFTAASLLSRGAVDTATVFDGNDGDFGTFRIRNSEGHDFGHLNFLAAFCQSNNIYFARAVGNLGAEEFYRDLAEFGFGQRTRFPYQGQAAGILNQPADWSGRSQATIAIGQEVAVTPLQLVMAAGAVANGGVLYAPRIVSEIRDRQDGRVQTCPPVPLRRVLSESLAGLLREAMTRVVDYGTGRGAALSWITVAGKTGTAQKCTNGTGYEPGKYFASFVGMVPAGRPRLVVLTILDEPRGIYHYAAQSAAPLFADIVTEIRRTTDWLTDVTADGESRTVAVAPALDVKIPDVMFLPVAKAEQELRRAGLQMAGGDKGGLVIEQIPAPGARGGKGSTVQVTVACQSAATGGSGSICPDLAGFSNRQVRRLAARLGVPVKISGVGYVRNQSPPAGTRLGPAGIRVRLEAPWL